MIAKNKKAPVSVAADPDAKVTNHSDDNTSADKTSKKERYED